MSRHSSPDCITGFVNIAKPADMTSQDAVSIVRGALTRATGERQKAGHLGTLDPLAEGVLPIALGKAARLFDALAFKKKHYTARFCFGKTTDTLDRGGAVTRTGDRIPDFSEVQAAAKLFEGETEQVPPAYSAKSVGGKRAYELARKGLTPELPPKRVRIYSFAPVSRDGDEFVFDIVCGGGTYIRSLARDIAAALGTSAYMSALTRLSSGAFSLDDAVSPEEFKREPLAHVLPVDFALSEFERSTVMGEQKTRLLNGVAVEAKEGITAANSDGEKVVVCDEEGTILGLGEISDGLLKLKTRL